MSKSADVLVIDHELDHLIRYNKELAFKAFNDGNMEKSEIYEHRAAELQSVWDKSCAA